MALTKKQLAHHTSAKRRLKVTNEAIPMQTHWIDWFLSRGKPKEAAHQRKHVDKLYRRKSRLETYLGRKLR